MGSRLGRRGTKQPKQTPLPAVPKPQMAPGMMKPPVSTPMVQPMISAGMQPGIIPTVSQPGMIPKVPVMRPQVPMTTIQPLGGGIPQVPVTTIPQMTPGILPQVPITTIQPTVTQPSFLPQQVPVTTLTQPVISPQGLQPQLQGQFIPLGSTISQLPMECRSGSRPYRYGGGLGSFFPSTSEERPLCPNELSETDFNRLALLSGLDLPTINQLYVEFQQLTNGRGKLDREQYRDIFLQSFYHLAMQNLDRLAEQTFRSFDRDSNGALDFFDFIAAYKSNTPRLGASTTSQLFNLGIPTSL